MEYDELIDEYNYLLTEYEDLKLQYETLQEEYDVLQEKNDNTVIDIKGTTSVLVIIIIVLFFAWLYEKGKKIMNVNEKFEKDLKELKDKTKKITLSKDFKENLIKKLDEEFNDTK